MPSYARATIFLFLAAAAAHFERSSAFSVRRPVAQIGAAADARGQNIVLEMSTTSSSIAAPSGALPLALKRPSKTLTVCLEYDYQPSTEDESEKPTATDLATLSMQLRKVKSSAIFMPDIDALAAFSKEQESARGDFPGPCPVIYSGDNDGIEAAVEAGASAVVLGIDSLDKAAEISGKADIIWQISSPQYVEVVLGVQEAADSFLVSGEDVEAIIEALPSKKACAIGSVDAMQDEEAEIGQGRALKTAGCSSIFIRGAIVGDAEDVDYASFAVAGLTSKASTEFNFSGLTGSANGHFGGVASSGKNKWKRNLSTNMVSNSYIEALEEEGTDTDSENEETPEEIATEETYVETEEKEKESNDTCISSLSDAALYFLSSSGLREIPEDKAKSAASSVKEKEDAARHTLESRIERLGISAGVDDDEAEE